MKESTRAMQKKHGLRIDRFIHNYIYFKFYYPYVRSIYYLFRFLAQYLSWLKPFSPILRAALNRYHAKVLSFSDTKKIFTLNEDISAISDKNRRIVPYKYAYKILFQEPEQIAVMDCPCKKTLKDEEWAINSCLAVGSGISSFWLEHGQKYHARRITQKEALGIIKKFRGKGYLTQAFFKVATGGSTGVICNCHPDTCVSLQATKFARRFNKNLSMNAEAGYIVDRNQSRCQLCGDCADICPVDCIEVDKKKSWTYNTEACLGCDLCIEHCPEKALSLKRDPGRAVPLDLDIVKEEYIQRN